MGKNNQHNNKYNHKNNNYYNKHNNHYNQNKQHNKSNNYHNNNEQHFSNKNNNWKKYNNSNEEIKINDSEQDQKIDVNNFSDQEKNENNSNYNELTKDAVNLNVNNLKSIEEELLKKDETIKELYSKIDSLEREIRLINIDYVEKVKEKSLEAQKQLEHRKKELEDIAKQDVNNLKRNMISNNFNSMLETINKFKSVINLETDDQVIKNFLFGFKMLSTEFDNALSDLNISTIDIKVGDMFDEKIMLAFETDKNPNFENNCVLKVIQPGYEYEKSIIKHAVVIVNKL